MPIFEYKCSKCSAVFELLVRGSEKPECPKCKSKRVKKLVSSFGVGKASASRRKNSGCGADCGGGGCCGGCACGM